MPRIWPEALIAVFVMRGAAQQFLGDRSRAATPRGFVNAPLSGQNLTRPCLGKAACAVVILM